MLLINNNGQLYLEGKLALQDTNLLIKQLSAAIAQQTLAIDISRVEEGNSILLAILITLQRRAKTIGRTLSYINWPNRLHSLIDLYGLHDLLGLPIPKKTHAKK